MVLLTNDELRNLSDMAMSEDFYDVVLSMPIEYRTQLMNYAIDHICDYPMKILAYGENGIAFLTRLPMCIEVTLLYDPVDHFYNPGIFIDDVKSFELEGKMFILDMLRYDTDVDIPDNRFPASIELAYKIQLKL